jgi:hypothetical protein
MTDTFRLDILMCVIISVQQIEAAAGLQILQVHEQHENEAAGRVSIHLLWISNFPEGPRANQYMELRLQSKETWIFSRSASCMLLITPSC